MSSFSARYTLRVPLGESALGSVWTALDRETQQQVAVLRLEEEAATETARARFRDHAKRLLAIDHPNVVKALDHGDDDEGIPYLAVELLEGESLAARWASAPIRIDRFVDLAVGVAEGLGALHAAGFSHGDVEPGNVFLVGARGMETPKLIGIALNRVYARVGDDGEDRTSVATLHQLYAYAAPEQVKGEVVDSPVADLYSLAAVVFAGLAGSPPHVAPTVMALLESVTRKKPPTLAQVKRELSAFSATLDRALSAEPGRRFPDAASFARALKTCLVMGRSVATQEIPVGARSPIGQPLAIGASSAGSTAAAKPLARSMPKPGALAVAQRPSATTAGAAKAETAAKDEPSAESALPPRDVAKDEAAKNDAAKNDAAKNDAAKNDATTTREATSPKVAMPAARPIPRPGAKKTIQGLPLATRPATTPAAAPPTVASDPGADEGEGRSTEELEIPLGSEVPPPPPPPRPPVPTAAVEERPSLEFEDYESAEIPLPPGASPPPPPPAPPVRAEAAPKPTIEDAASAPSAEAKPEPAGAEAPEAAAADTETPRPDVEPAEPEAPVRETAGAEAPVVAQAPVAAAPVATAAPEPAVLPSATTQAATPKAAESPPRAKPVAAPDPIASEPVLAPLDDDEGRTPARPAWIMPVAIAAVALLVVIGSVVAFGGGGAQTADGAEAPVVGPSATEPETAAAPTDTEAAAAEEPAGSPRGDETAEVAGEPDQVPEVEAETAEPQTPEPESAEVAEAAEAEVTEAEVAEAEVAEVAEAEPAPAVQPARPRTARRTAAARTTTRTAASRPRTTRPTTTRTTTTRGRPTVVADPGF